MTTPTQELREQVARPILFSGAMIRALLEGRKTQTRRIVKPQPIVAKDGCWSWSPHRAQGLHHGQGGSLLDLAQCLPRCCPYGVPGDVLWARETWGVGTRPCPSRGWFDGIEYRADCMDDEELPLYDIIPDHIETDGMGGKWRPSIHMPRWASRLTLDITDVRVERLQDICEADAEAEGVDLGASERHAWGQNRRWIAGACRDCKGWDPATQARTPACAYRLGDDRDVRPHYGAGCSHGFSLRTEAEPKRFQYENLWDLINGGTPGGNWHANPWVWVLAFTVHRQNVDAYLKARQAKDPTHD